MSPLSSDAPQADAVIIGGGLAGLTAAYAMVKQGLKPLVLEERGGVGGLVAGVTVDGVPFDIGAEAYVAASQPITDLVTELGLDITKPQGSSWVYSHDEGGRATQIPHGMLGIPASLDDPAVAQALTPAELTRAREDLTMGPEVGADCEDLASFVTARYGEALLTKIVGPVAGGIHSNDPAKLAVDTVCRGLRAGLAQHGSATAAVAAIRGVTPAGPTVIAPRGGMFRLPQALARAIRDAGGRIATHVRALGISPVAGGGWSVTGVQTMSNPNPALPPISQGLPTQVHTPRVVLALPLPAAIDILSMMGGIDIRGWRPAPGGPIAHVTLMLDMPALDDAPRGSGMLVRRPTPEEIEGGAVRAKALTHYSHKWSWMREDYPDTHILRVSYGRAGEPPVEVTEALARSDASRLLGVTIPREAVKRSLIVHWDGSLPPLTPEHWERVAALNSQIAANCPGFAVAGAWASGSGLSAVIPDGLAKGAQLAQFGPPSQGTPNYAHDEDPS
ncbi:MAG: FAD-dependent oxidoreductase [Actinomycetaceae bacterium]|nr:FAD-dependent oxidoreductase [Actinomycetaceae bacterium]MDU0969987.1 FAD-dependent oxidoreductase [Actinomycetaceae bacterium]